MKIRLNYILIGIAIIATAVAGCFMAQQQWTKQRLYFLSVHCDNINSDFTRPIYRECTKPISLKDNVFTFVNQGGTIEQYLIIGMNGGATDINHNSFIYDFIKYSEDK